MATIPSTAIQFYTSSAYTTTVSGGTAASTISPYQVYAKLVSGFNPVSSSKTVTFPYMGRSDLSGTKSFTSGGESKTLTVSMMAETSILLGNTITYNWSGQGTVSKSGLSFTAPKEAGTLSISGYTNGKYIKYVQNIMSDNINVTTRTANGTAITTSGVAVTGDPGEYGGYLINIVAVFEANTAIEDITDGGYLEISIGDTAGTMFGLGQIQFAQASEVITLTDSVVFCNTSDGKAQNSIGVASDGAWTIA